MKLVNPPALPKPVGYAHGVQAGKLLFISGQVAQGADFAAQFEGALGNVLAVVRAAGGQPEALVEMTVFVKDMAAYRASRKALGEAWQRHLGKHYPAMTLVAVRDLFEPWSVVEIRAIASLEEAP